MTKRPLSSVTTIFAKPVGSSAVSAITHTPASGPLGPVTVPLIDCAWAPSAMKSVANPAIQRDLVAMTSSLRTTILLPKGGNMTRFAIAISALAFVSLTHAGDRFAVLKSDQLNAAQLKFAQDLLAGPRGAA